MHICGTRDRWVKVGREQSTRQLLYNRWKQGCILPRDLNSHSLPSIWNTHLRIKGKYRNKYLQNMFRICENTQFEPSVCFEYYHRSFKYATGNVNTCMFNERMSSYDVLYTKWNADYPKITCTNIQFKAWGWAHSVAIFLVTFSD